MQRLFSLNQLLRVPNSFNEREYQPAFFKHFINVFIIVRHGDFGVHLKRRFGENSAPLAEALCAFNGAYLIS